MTGEEGDPRGPVGHTPHDSNPQMAVSVDFEAATTFGAGATEVAHVSINDSSHPGIRASLQYLVQNELGRLESVGFSVMHLVADRPEGAARFGPGVIKDLPLARWDRVAQAAVRQAVIKRSVARVSVPLGSSEHDSLFDGPEDPDEVIATPLHVSRDRRERAIEMVRGVRPDLDPNESKGAARSWNGLVRLAEAMDEYMEVLASGAEDPVGEMVRRHAVAPATVRTWVHRARQAGLTSTRWIEAPHTAWLPPGAGPGYDRSLTDAELTKPGEGDAFYRIGQALQKARLGKGLTVDDVAAATRMRIPIIHAIEQGAFSACGGDVYARGHIKSYARQVDLDSQDLLRQYDEAGGLPPPPPPQAPAPPAEPPKRPTSHRKPKRKRD